MMTTQDAQQRRRQSGSQKNKEDGDEEEGSGPVATALVDALRQVVASQFTSVILTC